MALYIPSINIALNTIIRAYTTEDYSKIKETMDYVINSPTIAGDEDDYHNAAVGLVRFDDYHNAVLLLEHGLKRYEKSTDILADLLAYGSKCRKSEEIINYYFEGLSKIDKRFWSWRAFTFSIDILMTYIQYAKNKDQEYNIANEIKSLIADYKQYMPNDERAYMAEYNFYDLINEHASAEEALKTAMETLKICSQCVLKYADILFEQGKFREVIPLAERITRIVEAQPSVNMGYVYYMLALSKEAVLRENGSRLTTDNVRPIFDAYYCALENFDGGRNTLILEIHKKVIVLERISGVQSKIEMKGIL